MCREQAIFKESGETIVRNDAMKENEAYEAVSMSSFESLQTARANEVLEELTPLSTVCSSARFP